MVKKILLLLTLAGCTTAKTQIPLKYTNVYKTKADYSQLVPVGYADGKIISYPAATDLRSLPIALKNGYWYDTIGISPQTAYLTLPIATYKQKNTSFTEFVIKDAKPFTEFYRLEIPFNSNKIEFLNKIIEDDKLGDNIIKE